MYYFAYGSNMSSKRLNARIKATKYANGKLLKHKLKFHKISKDGSGKCDAFETGDSNDFVLGVVYEIDKNDLEQLDRFEAKGKGYERKEVEIILEDENTISAITYYATNIGDSFLPYDWYLKHVLFGAEENKLENTYINYIRKIYSKKDTDKSREVRELSIYN
ncbi:gamma-glutamylcyclotransferase [Aliarcobacter butzleri]|uniref:gamma-glutamylcyclotransferase family protein n=1 Tax=Aliarcobacter butzleri TaxID=28197 RepID=UPI001EDBEE56|nr:gamma-glutamylcyclotransferase family protein [Aliarcobacter butzleri]MCG3706503.1 gamma-glutamylcyclotransferase [Aliarcobacter butzleri]MDN5088683.1 gamma-glutamylcyclotransferase [Aliarcobacter butzleri]